MVLSFSPVSTIFIYLVYSLISTGGKSFYPTDDFKSANEKTKAGAIGKNSYYIIYQFKKIMLIYFESWFSFFNFSKPFFQITQHMSTLQQLCKAPTETALEFSLVSVNTELITKMNFFILLLLKLTWLQSHFFPAVCVYYPKKTWGK